MLFPSPTFLWLFLPAVVAAHGVSLRWSVRVANTVLLGASLAFYTWGSGALVVLLAVSVAVDWIAGALADRGYRTGDDAIRRLAVLVSVIGNVGLLGWFKYAGFVSEMINDLSKAMGGGTTRLIEVALPIGISFFTFQSMSYTFDVAAGRARAFRSPLTLLLYVSLFPQLIAGPIVRVTDVQNEIGHRRVGSEDLAAGFERFAWGLAKKVLVADSVAPLSDAAFAADPTTASAWIAAGAYAVQIYFDFSGYSDMAIGLGRMVGFTFPENFRRPYSAATVTDFWRRWHITLSSWFRDYIYIPLGGSRAGVRRTYRNLIMVFVITGLWHGAAWTFLIWGIWHGAALLIERRLGVEAGSRGIALRVWTALVVLSGWIWFRAEGAGDAIDLLRAAVVPSGGLPAAVAAAMTPVTVSALVLGLAAAAMPSRISPREWLSSLTVAAVAVRATGFALLLPLVAMRIVGDTFSPFLYFRF
jgi:alginate O-acetyltransferase complex protein AlgI